MLPRVEGMRRGGKGERTGGGTGGTRGEEKNIDIRLGSEYF